MKHICILLFAVFLGWPTLSSATVPRTCASDHPQQLTNLSAEEVTALEQFVNAGSRISGLRLARSDFDARILPFDCTSTGALVETLLIWRGTGVSMSGFEMMRDDRYVVRVTRRLLEMHPSIIELVAIHEVCHILQKTAPFPSENIELYEEWAERCVTEVLGEEAHAIAYANLFLAGSFAEADPNMLLERARAIIADRMERIPNPFLPIPSK